MGEMKCRIEGAQAPNKFRNSIIIIIASGNKKRADECNTFETLLLDSNDSGYDETRITHSLRMMKWRDVNREMKNKFVLFSSELKISHKASDSSEHKLFVEVRNH